MFLLGFGQIIFQVGTRNFNRKLLVKINISHGEFP